MVTGDLQDIKESLLNNALFRLSLGSKELFHSNFISGILELNDKTGKPYAYSFFEELKIDTPINCFIETEREKNNQDIIVNFYSIQEDDSEEREIKKEIIIENKVKSLPDLIQLEKYYSKIKNKTICDFYLLSLIEPDFKEPIGWKFLSYLDISVAIKNSVQKLESQDILPEFGTNIPFNSLITEYCSFIEELHSLAVILKTDINDPFDFYSGVINDVNFKEIRLHDLLLKLKYNAIKNLIIKDYRSANIINKSLAQENANWLDFNNYEVRFGYGFTRSSGLTDVKFYIGEIQFHKKLVPHYFVVQLQSNQIRYASELIKIKGITDDDLMKIHISLKGVENMWFYNNILEKSNFTNDNRLGDGKGKKNAKAGYCKFGEEFYFKYDLVKSNVTIKSIIEYYRQLANWILINRNEIRKANDGQFRYSED